MPYRHRKTISPLSHVWRECLYRLALYGVVASIEGSTFSHASVRGNLWNGLTCHVYAEAALGSEIPCSFKNLIASEGGTSAKKLVTAVSSAEDSSPSSFKPDTRSDALTGFGSDTFTTVMTEPVTAGVTDLISLPFLYLVDTRTYPSDSKRDTLSNTRRGSRSNATASP